MNYRPLPIGISDFAEMIEKEYYYVDKTSRTPKGRTMKRPIWGLPM